MSKKDSTKGPTKPTPDEEEEEEDEVAVERLETWYIMTTVHNKTIPVTCGDGSQRIRWLAHVSIARWDEQHCQGWKRLGIPVAVRLNKKDGEEIDMNLSIREVLQNGDQVYVETSMDPSETR